MTDPATILFVSATSGNASVMTDFLTDQGYQAEPATTLDGFDAALDSQSQDLVLIDADGFPPDVWGRCQRLQQHGIPFFVISQHGDAVDEKGREHDAARVFKKPLGQGALLETIQHILEDE